MRPAVPALLPYILRSGGVADRGLSIDHSTIARWVLRYALDLNKRIRRDTRLRNRSSRVDETYVRVAGK